MAGYTNSEWASARIRGELVRRPSTHVIAPPRSTQTGPRTGMRAPENRRLKKQKKRRRQAEEKKQAAIVSPSPPHEHTIIATTVNFNRDTARDDVLSNLGSAFNDPSTDPDIEITCNGYKWKCHKLVLRKGSEWFQRAFDGDSKESASRPIDLQEELPHAEDAVEAVLKFCYSLDYSDQDQAEPATFNVRMFSLAEKYSVKGLDLLALDKFIASTARATPPDLIQAISAAYTPCSDSKPLLRNAIIKHICGHQNFLTNFSGEKEEYNELTERIPRFAVDMTRVLTKQMQASRAV